jgi:hypothetical protein
MPLPIHLHLLPVLHELAAVAAVQKLLEPKQLEQQQQQQQQKKKKKKLALQWQQQRSPSLVVPSPEMTMWRGVHTAWGQCAVPVVEKRRA